ncbi:MAG: polyprenyl synthetase family protein [Anaerotruncus sp.]|nr:polyprenyl synthetase family protein [Anaerotruncus sp.]
MKRNKILTEEQVLSGYVEQINEALREQLAYPSCLQDEVIDAMRYSLLDAGKRLRGVLVLEFGRLCGAPEQAALTLACAVEMVHAYSLIHDDLPCMDNDDFRRGKPSCHKQFGEATALLAGDALLTLAFETATAAKLEPAQTVAAVSALAKAAGVLGMVGGQVIDLASEGKQVPIETLDTLYARKTGALLRVSAYLGCLAGNADAQFFARADAYAKACGLAFQITDDILDVVGDEKKLGKPIGSDQENEKTTYVTLFGLEGARQKAAELLVEAQDQVAAIPGGIFLLWLADRILNRDH